MAQQESYMLDRDAGESKRLDRQHLWAKAAVDDHLLHPTIPTSSVCAVADIATGTGVWLRDLRESWPSLSSRPTPELVGFDISPLQFPNGPDAAGISFCVQDAAQPFPAHYHERFDVVNVRLMSFAIQTKYLDAIVSNIATILRPGGYLQWQECDMVDAYATPETQKCRDMVEVIIQERISRGLFPGISTPLLVAIAKASINIPENHLNPLSWTSKAFRILSMRVIPSLNHPSKHVRDHAHIIVLKITEALLVSATNRMANEPSSTDEMDQLIGQKMKAILNSIQNGDEELVGSKWECDTTLILARKGIVLPKEGTWMELRYHHD